jgi:hypothetical protein
MKLPPFAAFLCVLVDLSHHPPVSRDMKFGVAVAWNSLHHGTELYQGFGSLCTMQTAWCDEWGILSLNKFIISLYNVLHFKNLLVTFNLAF